MHSDAIVFCFIKQSLIGQISRYANHSDFCGIIPFFKADFRIMILDVKIPQNNNFTSKNGTG